MLTRDVGNINGEYLQLRDELRGLGLLHREEPWRTRTPQKTARLQRAIDEMWDALADGPEMTREQLVAIVLTGESFVRPGPVLLEEYYRYAGVLVEPGNALLREGLMEMIAMEQRGESRQAIGEMLRARIEECRGIHARAECALTGAGTGLPQVAQVVTTERIVGGIAGGVMHGQDECDCHLDGQYHLGRRTA